MHYSQLPTDLQCGLLRPQTCASLCPPVYNPVYPPVQNPSMNNTCMNNTCTNNPCMNCPCGQPTACTSALYNQATEELTVNDEAVVPLPNVTTVGSDLSYDVNTGLITVSRAGVYLFYWNVLAEPTAAGAGTETPLVFALENTAGQVYALSGNNYITAEANPVPVTGTVVRYLPAGTNVALYNRSGTAVRLDPVTSTSGLAFGGALTAVKIC